MNVRTIDPNDYTAQRIKNREDAQHNDARCPACKSRRGSKVTRSFPIVSGRIRDRICMNCAYLFQTTEQWPTEKGN